MELTATEVIIPGQLDAHEALTLVVRDGDGSRHHLREIQRLVFVAIPELRRRIPPARP